MARVNPTSRSATLSAYSRLRGMLLNWRFAPGRQLQPAALADRMSVSATPVREALIRLCAEGFVVSTPSRGFFTKALNQREMTELFELALVLLRHSLAKELRPALTSSEIGAELRAWDIAAGGLAPTGRIEAYTSLLERLHERLVGSTGNAAMMLVIRNFNDRTHFVRLLGLECQDSPEHTREDVRSLLESLDGADRFGALRALDRLFERQVRLLPSLVKEGLARAHAALGPANEEGRPADTLEWNSLPRAG